MGGHQRVRAAETEGIDRLPVVYDDLDEPSEKQLNLALNRISGEFDTEKLAAVLADLEHAGADLALTGFTDSEIDELVRGLDEPQDGLTDPDAVPEPPDEPARRPRSLLPSTVTCIRCATHEAGSGTCSSSRKCRSPATWLN